MSTKTERMELRVSEADKTAIAEAAALENTTPSEFARHAALEAAHRLHARASVTTLMPADQFDALIESLDVPDHAPHLARAFAHKRRFTQR